MPKKVKTSREDGDCVISGHPVPVRELSQYSVDNDPHSENDIANYVHGQARDETVQHVERIKQEVVLGDKYEIWDVITDKRYHQSDESLLAAAFSESRLHTVISYWPHDADTEPARHRG